TAATAGVFSEHAAVVDGQQAPIIPTLEQIQEEDRQVGQHLGLAPGDANRYPFDKATEINFDGSRAAAAAPTIVQASVSSSSGPPKILSSNQSPCAPFQANPQLVDIGTDCYAELWQQAGCTQPPPEYTSWHAAQSLSGLQEDARQWASLVTEKHRLGCYGRVEVST
ncbi:unnamed protein product, partial [Amoebophrya sp. A120]